MANYYTPFSLHVSEEPLAKIKVIAVRNKRSANKEIEYALEQYVKGFEERHEEVMIDGDELPELRRLCLQQSVGAGITRPFLTDSCGYR